MCLPELSLNVKGQETVNQKRFLFFSGGHGLAPPFIDIFAVMIEGKVMFPAEIVTTVGAGEREVCILTAGRAYCMHRIIFLREEYKKEIPYFFPDSHTKILDVRTH